MILHEAPDIPRYESRYQLTVEQRILQALDDIAEALYGLREPQTEQ